MRLCLFDIDGTMLHSHGAGARAMERVGRELHGPGFSLAEIDFAGALDPWIYAEAARRMGAVPAADEHARFLAAYLLQLARELEHGEPVAVALPGVHEALARLATHATVTLGLLTGNYVRAAELKLRAVGIDPNRFLVSACGEEAATRPDLVRLALQRWAARGACVDPEAVVVIGDTPRDVDCARRNGCRCVAVATGKHSVEVLTASGADVVLPNLANIEPLLSLLGLS